jgi:ABC-type spermidine/putrescine transport system permease subunit II
MTSRRLHLGDWLIRSAAKVLVAAIVVFGIVPAAIVVISSFSGEQFLEFPPGQWGFTQYSTLFHTASWADAVVTSFELAIPAGILTVAIALPAVFAITSRHLPRVGQFLQVVSLGPLLIPVTAYVVALYLIFLRLHIVGSFPGLIFAQSLSAIPVAILVMASALRRIPRSLELAAMSLGASRLRAVIGVTGRQLAPAIAASFIVGFLFSFDDAIFVTFLGGASVNPLARQIFDSLRVGVDPVVTAISTLLMAFTATLITLGAVLRRHTS